jgi:hypothetical protein
LPNLETLILVLTSRLFALRNHPGFPNPETAPEKDALNCIRVLTRILPYIYEADNLEQWEEKFFWGARRKRARKGQPLKTEIMFDESNPEADDPKAEVPEVPQEEFEDAKPLAEELIDTLADMLFFSGFTLPTMQRLGTKTKVNYTIWSSGIGCNTPVSTYKELEANRTEVLRLLITLTSKSMYMPPS